MAKLAVTVNLPDWAVQANAQLPDELPDVQQRMAAVVDFSRRNIEQETGGPFAAGIFEKESGKPVVIGVNRVLPLKMSSAHAEIVTLTLAQKILGTFDLGGSEMDYQLVVNARPCAMCYGSIPWSGVRSLVIGASGDQVETLTGFDEGPIHPNWRAELERRGIEVVEDVLADQACEVLTAFAQSDAVIYNGRQLDR